MGKKIFLILILLLWPILLGNNVHSKSVVKKEITLYTLNWPPYVGEDIDNYGFCYELVKRIFELKGYNVKVKFQPWARIMDLAKKGDIDGYFPAYYSKERAVHSYFSKKILSSQIVFLTLKTKNISHYKTLYDLKEYTIGLVRGYVNREDIDSARYLVKDYAVDDLMNLRKLLKGRVDLIVIDKYVAYYFIKKYFLTLKNKFQFLYPTIEDKPLYVCFPKKRKGATDFLKDFNKGLEILTQNGTIDIMFYKWIKEIE